MGLRLGAEDSGAGDSRRGSGDGGGQGFGGRRCQEPATQQLAIRTWEVGIEVILERSE